MTDDLGMESEPVTNLRGASVKVDVRRVRHLIVGACLVALAAGVIVLSVAGAEKNSQINQLRRQGVPVELTVSGCTGMMGGSGSNLAGYDCRGTFTLSGHRYSEAIPGTVLYTPGTRIRAISVPQDPALVSTPRALLTQHASMRVFLLPAVLLVVFGLFVATVVRKRAGTARRRLGFPSSA